MITSPSVLIEGPDVLELAFCNVMATINFRRTFYLQIYNSVTLHSVAVFCDGVEYSHDGVEKRRDRVVSAVYICVEKYLTNFIFHSHSLIVILNR